VTEIKKPYGRGGIISIGGGNDYIPPKGVTGSDGGGLRSSTRMDELLPGYIVPPLKDTDDIVSMAMDRTGARHLDFMLREGYVKRHKVAKLCREMLTPYAAKLAVHGEHFCLCCVGSCIGNAIFCVLFVVVVLCWGFISSHVHGFFSTATSLVVSKKHGLRVYLLTSQHSCRVPLWM
jgi:hypothetical protein